MDEEIAEKYIHGSILISKIIKGKDAARKLIDKQWEGILEAKGAEMLVKLNSVLIPEITHEIEKLH